MRAQPHTQAPRSPAAPAAVRPGTMWDRVVGHLRSGIDPDEPEAQFVEPLIGLHMREIAEPDVFRRYFAGATR
jgi:hypothetical protein